MTKYCQRSQTVGKEVCNIPESLTSRILHPNRDAPCCHSTCEEPYLWLQGDGRLCLCSLMGQGDECLGTCAPSSEELGGATLPAADFPDMRGMCELSSVASDERSGVASPVQALKWSGSFFFFFVIPRVSMKYKCQFTHVKRYQSRPMKSCATLVDSIQSYKSHQ